MALIRSQIATVIVGSIAGLVYFYNRYGAIVVRSRTIPTNPNTAAQQTVRAQFAAAVSGWKTLRQSERDAWEAWATSTPWKNAIGDVIHLTGQNTYIAIRTASRQAVPALPASTWDDSPCTPGHLPMPFGSCSLLPANGANIGFSLTVSNNSAIDTIRASIYLSTGQSPSINYWKGPYDTTKYHSGLIIGPGASLAVSYVGLSNGLRYFWKIRALLHDTYINMSTPIHGYCTARPQAT